MSSAERTFGAFLKRFALSVDIVDEDSFKRIGTLVQSYVADELQIEYFEVMDECVIDEKPGLKTMWCSEAERNRSKTILSDDGTATGQTTLSYHLGKPMWIVSPDRETLEETDVYVDLWSGTENLPAYQKPVDMDIRTSISVPLKRGRKRLGVIYLESPQYVEITEVAKQELSSLADAVALLCLNREATKTARATTGDAISELEGILSSSDLPRMAKPQFFVATSSRSDPKVVGMIMKVLGSFSDKVNATLWSDVRESGPIDRQIVEAINRSRFGVCYLSESDDDTDFEWDYRDNPNVLFEAGMLHSLTSSDSSGGWIPLREENSPAPPFDFAHERIEIVPRNNGSLNEQAFEANLKGRIEHLLVGD